MANLLSTIINGFISSKLFVPGFMGSGWKIWNHTREEDSKGNPVNRYKLEIDDLVVRNTMTVFELLISKIRALKGAMAITQANGKVKSVTEDASYFYLEIEDEMSFVEYDIVRCQRFEKNKLRGYWVEINSVEEGLVKIAKSEFDKNILGEIITPPLPGDELVQFGNAASAGALKYRNRRSAIYLSADEGGLPAIDVLQGIHTKSFEGCMKLRIGGLDGITDTDFPEGISDFGLYCVNGYFKGTIAGAGVFMLRSDGSGYLAKGKISWDRNGNLTLGKGVNITWDNLSEDAKENLKGKDADIVFPWLQEWNQAGTHINNEWIASPRVFSGKTNPDGTLTGVALGKELIEVDGQKRAGLFGVKNGKITFSLDAETGDAGFNGSITVSEKFKRPFLQIDPGSDNSILDISGKTNLFIEVDNDRIVNLPVGEDGQCLQIAIRFAYGNGSEKSKVSLSCLACGPKGNYYQTWFPVYFMSYYDIIGFHNAGIMAFTAFVDMIYCKNFEEYNEDKMVVNGWILRMNEYYDRVP